MPGKVHVIAIINGEKREFLCEPLQTLLEVLRDELKLTGTKEGCSNGNCGACSVVLDGLLVDSCLVLGVEVEGRSLVTIEGLMGSDGLHPLQKAFLENAALQCGICTPGFIMAAKALLDKNPRATEAEVRQALSAVLCRCHAHSRMLHAVTRYAKGVKA